MIFKGWSLALDTGTNGDIKLNLTHRPKLITLFWFPAVTLYAPKMHHGRGSAWAWHGDSRGHLADTKSTTSPVKTKSARPLDEDTVPGV